MAENKSRREELEQALGFRIVSIVGGAASAQLQFLNDAGVVTRVRPATMEEERMWNALMLGESMWGELGSPLDGSYRG